ncbi:hypothetical protein Tco_1117729 [Tanacetum coccineum]
MKRASKGYTGENISLFPTMIVQGLVVQGEGSTHPIESHHIPTSALSTSQPPISPTSRRTNKQGSVVLQPRSPTQSPVADKAASLGVDIRYRGATTTVIGLEAGQGSGNIDKTPTMPQDSPLLRVNTLGSDEGSMTLQELMVLCRTLSKKVEILEADLKQTKLTYGAAYTKLIKKVKKLENKVKSSQARRRARIIVSDNEDDLKDPSKQGKKIAEIDQDPAILLVQHDAKIQGRNVHDIDFDFDFDTAKEVSTAEKDVSTAEPVFTVGAAVTTASVVAVSTASPTRRVSTTDDITMAETLVYIRKSATKDKSKGKMDEYEYETAQTKTKLHSKRQKIGESSEPAEEPKDKEEELSQEELQQMMIIVLEQRINVEALQTKYLIIDWEIYTEGTKNLVKEKFNSTEPTDDKEREIWLYDSCGVHHMSIEKGIDIYMLVEKEYPLSRGTLTLMLVAKLLVEQDNEMSRELLRKIFMQAERPRR